MRNELPALLRLLESFFGSGAPHALAVLARMKYAESRDDNDSFRNEWQEMASQFREYLSAIGKNMVIVLESNGFSKSGADGPVCYRRAFEGKRNESVAAIFDTRAREMLFFVNGERVRGGDVLWRGDLRFVEEICQFLDGYSPDLVAFAEAMAARIRGDAAGA